MTSKKKLLSGIEDALLDAIGEHPDVEDLDEETISGIVENVKSGLVNSTIETLNKNAPSMLREHRKVRRGFETRNFKRWRAAFDLLEKIVVTATELGEMNNKETREELTSRNAYAFEAISQLHPRALLVAQEIYCLLRGGFPDGALARWRTLHEINVTAMFIAKHGDDMGLSYLASSAFNDLRAANQYNEYSERANLSPIEPSELEKMLQRRDAVEVQVGRKIGRDYDWAKHAFTKGNISLFDLECDVGMDHWRPWFRWACTHNHSGHRAIDNVLGMVESDEVLALVGPSNSGFVDPLQMTALSLSQMTTTYLMCHPNIDRTISSEIIVRFATELAPLAIDLEKRTLEASKKRRLEKVLDFLFHG